ncbi:hypothetical protein [Ruminococcus sp.]|uniref:hypothetical protein n=1 Tax=Ruminococcus sp. TaxID=41978 RepID=UPI0025D42599|nr:hypothetical protein [Ruminococcus sp.]
MDKQEMNALKKDIQKLKTTKKKQMEAADKCRDKITSLQSELSETEKSIEETEAELVQKEALLKKAEYSSALQKLDDAILSKFSKRQAELLTKRIMSGELNSLLTEDNVVTSDEKENVATNSNE